MTDAWGALNTTYEGNTIIAVVHDDAKAILTPVAGFEIHVFKYPNWFWRKMTWLAFGWRWKKK